MSPIRFLLCVAFLTFIHQSSADDQVRSVQEELRRRNLYFGDIDGRRSGELSEAVKRYQQRKGFSATGDDDRQTLRSLGLLPRAPGEPPPKELEWPEEPVLKSDARINVAAIAEEIAAETGISPASVAPKSAASNQASSGKRGRAKRGTAAGAPSHAAANPRFSAAVLRAEPEQVRRLIRDYVRAVSGNDVRDELRFYADQVVYFENGDIDRRIIERSLRDYYKRWPKRKYSVADEPVFRFDRGNGQILVVVPLRFTLKNGGKAVRGITLNEFIVNAATSDPRIVSIRERRLRG
jgi:peptidoglycan hydrolase-like protein with peptidoglycan-binding domain